MAVGTEKSTRLVPKFSGRSEYPLFVGCRLVNQRGTYFQTIRTILKFAELLKKSYLVIVSSECQKRLMSKVLTYRRMKVSKMTVTCRVVQKQKGTNLNTQISFGRQFIT